MKKTFHDIPKDIINNILIYLNDEDYKNCLLTSKIFHVYNHNETYKQLHLERIELEYKYGEYDDIDELLEEEDYKGIKWLIRNEKMYITDMIEIIDRLHNRNDQDFLNFLYDNLHGKLEHYTVLEYASRNGYLDAVKWMHLNKDQKITEVALIEAASRGHYDIIEWMEQNSFFNCEVIQEAKEILSECE